MKPLSLGFSPCPNDTFIFYALVHNLNGTDGPLFEEPALEDVETLNSWAFEHRLDVTKLSFHAFGHLCDEYCVLQAGSALGRGCGPLLVAGGALSLGDLAGRAVAIPGRYTTAALLFRMFMPQCTNLVEMRFENIMDAVVRGDVAAGVIIHESRFTYSRFGLSCLQDLGQWWENISGLPIPLGCIVARRSLGVDRIADIELRIQASLDYANGNPYNCMPYVRQHSQEMEDDVVRNHIGLYVNDFSRALGDDGKAAIETFLAKGRKEGILPVQKKSTFCLE